MESFDIKIDPTEFDITISALLTGLGGEKYIDIFRKRNIGQCTLTELSDEDLIKLGVDNADIRIKLLEEIKNLPIYEEPSVNCPKSYQGLNPIEIADILEESSQHLYKMYLSILSNTLALKKTENLIDCQLLDEKYASNIALMTMSEINNILNSMDIAVHMQMKELLKESKNINKKKMVVGTVGAATIVVLAVLFVKSLKQL